MLLLYTCRSHAGIVGPFLGATFPDNNLRVFLCVKMGDRENTSASDQTEEKERNSESHTFTIPESKAIDNHFTAAASSGDMDTQRTSFLLHDPFIALPLIVFDASELACHGGRS